MMSIITVGVVASGSSCGYSSPAYTFANDPVPNTHTKETLQKEAVEMSPKKLFPYLLPQEQALAILHIVQKEKDTAVAIEQMYIEIQRAYSSEVLNTQRDPKEVVETFIQEHGLYYIPYPVFHGDEIYPFEIGTLIGTGTVQQHNEHYQWQDTTTLKSEIRAEVLEVLRYMKEYLNKKPHMNAYLKCPSTVAIREVRARGAASNLAGFYKDGTISLMSGATMPPLWRKSTVMHEWTHACTPEWKDLSKNEFQATVIEMSLIGEYGTPAERGEWIFNQINQNYEGTPYESFQIAVKTIIGAHARRITVHSREEDFKAMPELRTHPLYAPLYNGIPTFYARKELWDQLQNYVESLCPTHCATPSDPLTS